MHVYNDAAAAVHVYNDAAAVALAAAELFVAQATKCVAANGRFTVLLSGGSTPQGMCRLLAGQFRPDVPWDQTWLFWGDERVVPFDNPQSNYGNARHAFIDAVGMKDENVFPVPVDLPTPQDAAAAYEITTRALFNGGVPKFDLVWLGLGSDGPTASLFPGTPAVDEKSKLVVAGHAPDEPRDRITVTLPLIAAADRVVFVVTGQSKVAPLRAILEERRVDPAIPASLVTAAVDTEWLVDRAALSGQG